MGEGWSCLLGRGGRNRRWEKTQPFDLARENQPERKCVLCCRDIRLNKEGNQADPRINHVIFTLLWYLRFFLTFRYHESLLDYTSCFDK